MRGDALASGDKRATFAVAPGLKFDEGQMRDDLRSLDAEHFMLKYMITQREYDLINSTKDEEKVSSFAVEMAARADAARRAVEIDTEQEAKLDRECFLRPFVAVGLVGKIIVSRDKEVLRKEMSNLLLPKSMRKQKTLLPTTGHIIKAAVFTQDGKDISPEFVGMRVLFAPMSGTAICFTGYPTWFEFDIGEIMAEVLKEDVDVIDEDLEPIV